MNPTRHISTEHVPVRQCVGCRVRAPQHDLLRIAVVNGRASIDPRRRLMGRGAYVHGQDTCVDRAIKRGGIFRSLRISAGRVNNASLRGQIDVFLQRKQSMTECQSSNEAANYHSSGLTQPEARLVVGTSQPKDQ